MPNAIDVHIQRLRDLEPADTFVPTTEQLLTVTDDIYDCKPLAETLARPVFDGVAVSDLTGIAETFGQYMARAYRGRPKAEPKIGTDSGFLVMAPARGEIDQARTSRAHLEQVGEEQYKQDRRRRNSALLPHKKLLSFMAYMPEEYWTDEAAPVNIPPGYEPSVLGREIVTSLAALVNTKPTPADVDRFFARKYEVVAVSLTAEHVHLVRWLASHDLGRKLDELTPKEHMLAGLLVQAYDVLDQHRQDAIDACTRLADPHVADGDLEDLRAALNAVSWLNEGGSERVEKALDAAIAAPENARLRSLVATRISAFLQTLEGTASALRDVKFLNEGHVVRLCDRLGLNIESHEERKARETIRERLVQMGLEGDLDRALPAGLDAWRNNTLEEFYAAQQAAASGDAVLADLEQAAEALTTA